MRLLYQEISISYIIIFEDTKQIDQETDSLYKIGIIIFLALLFTKKEKED